MHKKYSRRAFDGLIKIWRKELHKFDPDCAEKSDERTSDEQTLDEQTADEDTPNEKDWADENMCVYFFLSLNDFCWLNFFLTIYKFTGYVDETL